jgi:Ubiquitin-activating enzyme E1 FCCH domain
MSATITGNLTPTGRVNTPPATLYAEVIADATVISPGLTILPAALTEDMAGTATGALVIIDQAVTETLNSISPNTANPYLLTLQGQIYLGAGSTAAPASNTAVYCVFTGSSAGFIIPPGFTVGDGTNQYTVQDGGIIETGNASQPLFCLATQPGSWQVPPNTVTTLTTSAPAGYTLSVTNPLAGTPGGPAQTVAQFRAQVMQAGLSNAQGMAITLKALVGAVAGVQPQLISLRQTAAPAWEVIVGGTGDPYAIAYAVWASLFDVNTLVGSTLAVTGITTANPGVVTTNLNHGYSTGQVVVINGVVGMTGINGVPIVIVVLSPTTFSIINTTSFGTWTSGGVATPNFRNVTVTINDYPDSYAIPLVIPPVQTVAMTVTWNTLPTTNFVSPTGVASLAQPALAAYINSIFVGAPINVLILENTFQDAVASILPANLLDVLVFSVSINGIVTAPGTGTKTIFGDPESYFSCAAPSISVVQG